MYRDHRARLMERLRSDRAAAVVPTATHKTRNNDTEYRFRPESDFWYLTGFAEPESFLVLLPGLDGADDRSILFLRDKDRTAEIWGGRRLGVEAAPAKLGVDEARDVANVWTELPKVLKGYERIVYRTGRDGATDRRMLDVLDALRRAARGEVRPPVEILDALPYLHELRLYKSEAELDNMRRAAAITTEAHVAVMREAHPGGFEYELDALLDYTFRRHGGTGSSYTNIVAGGANACILHYVENGDELRDGDLLLVDAGAEWDYYASDVTRTFPVNGRFSEAQRELYEVVLGAQLAGIDQVKPGSPFLAVHEAARDALIDGMIRLGLLDGTRDEALESESYRTFYMHSTSHWLGLDVHDCGYTHADGAPRVLEPGMVLTVEPGLYVDTDADVDERWRGIGIRIEDDVVVTPDGNEVLSAGVPKTVEDVEAACAGTPLAGAV